MAVAKKVRGFISQSSWIRKMFEEGNVLKKQYGVDNVYDFSIGNPSVEPPVEFKKALTQIASEDIAGAHGYMSNAGFLETRAAVAAFLSHEHSVQLSADHVIMTCGAAGALNVVCKVLLDKGAKVDLVYADGSTALMSASHNGHTEIVRLLLDHGSNANARDTTGSTALIAGRR